MQEESLEPAALAILTGSVRRPIAYEAGRTEVRHRAQSPRPVSLETLLNYCRNISVIRPL